MTCHHCGIEEQVAQHEEFATDRPLCNTCKADFFRAEGCRICGRHIEESTGCRAAEAVLAEAAQKPAATEEFTEKSKEASDAVARGAAHGAAMTGRDISGEAAIHYAVHLGLGHDLFSDDLHHPESFLARSLAKVVGEIPANLREVFDGSAADGEELIQELLRTGQGKEFNLYQHRADILGEPGSVKVLVCHVECERRIFTTIHGTSSAAVGTVCNVCGRRHYIVWRIQ